MTCRQTSSVISANGKSCNTCLSARETANRDNHLDFSMRVDRLLVQQLLPFLSQAILSAAAQPRLGAAHAEEKKSEDPAPAPTSLVRGNLSIAGLSFLTWSPEIFSYEPLDIIMPHSVKREADTAFEGRHDVSPRTTKRRRRSRRDGPIKTGESLTASQAIDAPALGGTHNAVSTQVSPQKSSPTSTASLPLEGKRDERSKEKMKIQKSAPLPESSNIPEPQRPLSRPPAPQNANVFDVQNAQRHKQLPKTVQKASRKYESDTGWTLSMGSAGGIFIDQDPLLAQEGQYIILPTRSEVRVYATSTSLLVRTLLMDDENVITTCFLAQSDKSHLFVATYSGSISIWDWMTGRKVGQFHVQSRTRHMVSLDCDAENEYILVLSDGPQKRCHLTVYAIALSTPKIGATRQVLSRTDILPFLKTFEQGRLLVVGSQDKLLVGYAQSPVRSTISSLSYTWREVTVPGVITSLDAQINRQQSTPARKVPVLDVVLGLQSGMIMIFDDHLYKLICKEKGQGHEDIAARRLHWHRNVVHTVKWSPGQNYVVSGGDETVLVIWQLDTHQKQFLPHLSTSILNLTVSPTGSAYALRLGDNSVMILSTADLLPSTNITGLAVKQNLGRSPMALHPTIANRLLAAIPAYASSEARAQEAPATLLQVYDIESGLQISRQALTRNMTTAINVAPTGQMIEEPSVDHIAISHNGAWLATVDQWDPESGQLDPMFLQEDDRERRSDMSETCLRFWIWSADDNHWELVTRVDEPHRQGSYSVLGVAFHPSKVQLATIGSDATVRIWSPKTRLRDGVAVKNKLGEPLYTWTCSQIVHGPEEATGSLHKASSAALAYSEDGSILAASWSWPDSGVRLVHLINSQTGQICLSQPDLATVGDASLVFSGRNLLCLSQALCIFDIVSAQIACRVSLSPEFRGNASGRHIAVNRFDATVAIGLASTDIRKPSRLIVFSLTNSEINPLFETRMNGQIKGLLALPTKSGYVVVDSECRIRYLKAPSLAHSLPATVPVEPEEVMRGLDSIFGSAIPAHQDDLVTPAAKLIQDEVDSTGPARPEDALGIISSSQMPLVSELFERVAGVFAKQAGAS